MSDYKTQFYSVCRRLDCPHFFRRSILVAVLILFVLFAPIFNVIAAESIRLQFNVNDSEEEPLPCRIHLKNEQGEAQKSPRQPFWYDHFVCSGRIGVNLVPGKYTWEIERGPEYERKAGVIQVTNAQPALVQTTLKRIVLLRDEGWYSADLHVHRPLNDIDRLILAEDLDFAPVISWWNNRNYWKKNKISTATTIQLDGHRLYNVMAGEDEREGGALLYFGLKQPLDLTVKSREVPASMYFAELARKKSQAVWIDIEKPFWWDLPVWLASGKMNSIGIANNHMCRNQMLDGEAWGKPRDKSRLPDVRGNGFWTQEIYYHMLNTGLRIPPSAGSASGVLPNPVGYNRVYVSLDQMPHNKEESEQGSHKSTEKLTRAAWFESLARGRCFVTNGPLLRVTANSQLPGATLKVSGNKEAQIKLFVKLDSNDRVPALEVIYNGELIKTIVCSEEKSQQTTVTFNVTEPGWFLVRAITDVKSTFRFASTAPWYIESDSKKYNGSRESAQFFLDWVNERIKRVTTNVKDETDLHTLLPWYESARDFWKQKVIQGEPSRHKHSFSTQRERLLNIVTRLENQPQKPEVIEAIRNSTHFSELVNASAPLTRLKVSINPESRVNIKAMQQKIQLEAGKPRTFLVHIENSAGITAPLRIRAIDLSTTQPETARWCDIQLVNNGWTSSKLSGAEAEFQVIQLTVQDPGLNEVRLIADAGQGTQDLGFRATTDLLIQTVDNVHRENLNPDNQ